jgi:hypothetical protein
MKWFLSPPGRILIAAFSILTLLLMADYFKPAELEVDLNVPRFRLVRRRIFFPDQSLEMEWKHSSRWSSPASEYPAVFGQKASGGFYAWEVETGSRFESLYRTDENGFPIPYEHLRTNVFSFEISTRPLHTVNQPLESAEKWAKRRR